jgi:hypothetical protein
LLVIEAILLLSKPWFPKGYAVLTAIAAVVADSGRMVDGHLFSTSISGSAWLSGGSVGPEGSVLCTALLVALWFLTGWLFPTAKFPVVNNTPEPLSTSVDSTAAAP